MSESEASFEASDLTDLASYAASQLGGSGSVSMQQVLTTRGAAFQFLGSLSGGGPNLTPVKGFDASAPTYVMSISGTFAGTPADAAGDGGGPPANQAVMLVDGATGMIVGSRVWSDSTTTASPSISTQLAQLGSVSGPLTTTPSPTLPAYMQAADSQLSDPTS